MAAVTISDFDARLEAYIFFDALLIPCMIRVIPCVIIDGIAFWLETQSYLAECRIGLHNIILLDAGPALRSHCATFALLR